MSRNWITLIPTDPNYIPPVGAKEVARELLAGFVPEAQEVAINVTDQVVFRDPSSNWSGVSCPFCGSTIQTWFFNVVDEKYRDEFRDLAVITPCCNSRMSLNDMNYIWPAGFSRFALAARDPNVYDLEPAQIQALEEILGCKLRQILAHI